MHHGVLDQGDDVVVGDAVADTPQMSPWNAVNASILPVSWEAKGGLCSSPGRFFIPAALSILLAAPQCRDRKLGSRRCFRRGLGTDRSYLSETFIDLDCRIHGPFH
jgi:hypothetical protein